MFYLKKIDKYISSIFWKIFIYTTVSFLFVNIIIDLFDRLKMFLDNHAPFYYYFYYYLIKTPYLLNFILPIATIFATFVTMHRLIKNNEILIIFNAGLSYMRIALPIIISSLFISFAGFILSEAIVPSANYKVDELEAKIKKRRFIRIGDKEDFSYKGKKGLIFSIRKYDHDEKSLSGLLVEEWKDNSIRYRADISKAVYLGDGRWLCENIFIKLFDDNEDEIALGIQQPMGHMVLQISETPSDFAQNVKKHDEMNFLELREFIRSGRESGIDVSKYLVELNMKFSFPLISFLVSLLGLGITIVNPKLNLSSIIGVSLGISFLFWGVIATFQSLGTAGRMSPVLAAWLPDIIMVAMGLYMILVKQRSTFK